MSAELVDTAVSGRALVLGVTVNEQPWDPAFEVPYVIALVGLEEDPSVRLTTNIVGVEPGDVFIGQWVRARFEQVEEFWIPVFEPDPSRIGQIGEMPSFDGERGTVRPRYPGATKFEDKVCLSGVGQSKVGRRLMVPPVALTVEACLNAIEDAGLELSDIDGLSTFPGQGLSGGISEGGIAAVEEALRIHPVWVNGASETAGQIGSIITAMAAVASGLCRHVLCFRTVWESTESALLRDGTIRPSFGRASGMAEFRSPYGAMSPANWIALMASNYLHRYGVGREMLGHIAITERANASRNPEAVYRTPISMDEYMDARMITSPFGLLDCDVPVDGAVAVIVSAIDAENDFRQAPVLVEAVGTQVLERLSWDQSSLDYLPQSQGAGRHLWTRTDLKPDDVDVALLYDGFTFNAVSWLEGMQFCGPGEAADFIDEGRGIGPEGRLPINPHGGQLSAGRLHGYGFVREAMLQLRNEAPGRQVSDASVAAVTAGGGMPGGALLLRRD